MPASHPTAESISPTIAPMRSLGRWLAVFTAASTLYAATAATTIQWQDYGQYTLRIVDGELFNELGLALAHLLHFWLGQLFIRLLPIEPAHAVALVSALAGAVTVAHVFGCVMSVTRRLDAAVFAAVSLGLANTFWRMSTMPECYTVTTALLSAELWMLALFLRPKAADKPSDPRWLIAAFFFNGLGLANHNLALLTGPVLGAVLIYAWLSHRVCTWRALLCAAGWLVGAAPYLALVVIEAVTTGDTMGAIRSALFGNHYAEQVMNATPSLKLAGISAAFTLLSFANLTLLFVVIGLGCIVVGRDRRALLLAWAAALVIHLLFVLRYNVIDQHTFLLPTYTLIVLFAGVGFAALADRWGAGRARKLFVVGLALALVAPGVYLAAASIARSQDVLGNYARNKPYRDDYRYLFVPWGAGETSAKRMADHAAELAGDDGVILVEDGMARFAVRYTVQLAERDRVTVHVLGRDSEQTPWPDWAGRRIALVPANTERGPVDPPDGWRWVADPPLFVLEPGDSAGEAGGGR